MAARKTTARKRSTRKTAKKSTKKKTTKATTKRGVAKKVAKKAAKKTTKKNGKRWSAHVMETSDALDLREHLFKQRSPVAIAKGLKSSAESSKRRKGTPFQSAMSMLNFYINRGGKNLSQAQRAKLDRAKDELRKQFGRD